LKPPCVACPVRENGLFAGSDTGGHRAAALYSLIETVKLKGIEPRASLTTVLDRVADHPINRIDDLLPVTQNRP
jgi:hypothetical protein